MAEVVGVVVGVVSLSVQLAESTQKLKRFYNAVKDAPKRLADMIDEIERLSELLTEMEERSASYSTDVGPKMQRCVASCRDVVDRFSRHANNLESRMKRHKCRGSVRFAMKTEIIEEALDRLERTKTRLMLAFMLYHTAEAEERELQRQSQAVQLQSQMQSLVNVNTTLVQQLTRSSSTRVLDTKPDPIPKQRPNVRRTAFRLRTPSWLSHTIWEIHSKRATAGWTISLRAYSVVPHDAAIFKACEHGDITRMQELFNGGFASPFDENQFGKGIFEVRADPNEARTQLIFV